jgi:hypothetical protein
MQRLQNLLRRAFSAATGCHTGIDSGAYKFSAEAAFISEKDWFVR